MRDARTAAARGRGPIAIAALVVASLALPLVAPPFWLRFATELVMWVALAQSWNIIGGYTGYLSFGHGAFFGIGAYLTGIAMVQWGVPFGLALLLAGLANVLLAVVIGVPTLRLRGPYFAIATWSFGELVRQTAIVLDVTGGSFGMRLPSLLHLPFFYYVMLGVTAATLVTSYLALEWSRFGYKLRAIREHEEAAASLGIATTATKLQAFGLSALFPGVLGGVYAYWLTYIHPDNVLSPAVTDQMVVMCLLGGVGSYAGPVVGALVMQGVSRLLWLVGGGSVLYIVFIGVVICLVVLFLPNGVIGLVQPRSGRPRRAVGA